MTGNEFQEASPIFYLAFLNTNLWKYKYAKLPLGPNQRRAEDIHLIKENINLREIRDKNQFLIEVVEPLAMEASYKIFAAGMPLGFYNMHLPPGVEFKSVWRQEKPCYGLTCRFLMQYDITADAFVFAVGLRPEYDQEVIDQIMQPGRSAGLLQ